MMRRSFSRIRHSPVAVLDIGTHKICCWIARLDEAQRFHILGSGHQATRGYYAGHVRDLEAFETTMTSAVHEAERSCGETVRRVFVSLSGAMVTSTLRKAHVSPLGKIVSEEDMQRLFLDARFQEDPEVVRTLHALPLEYTLDEERRIHNPCGMLGESLGGSFHVVSTSVAGLRNFLLAVEVSHLEPLALVASPYAAGLSVLTEDERMLGGTLIDLGAGGTSLSVFWGGQLVHTDFVPLGGQHVTTDLAHGLETSLLHAERLKVLYGACFANPKDSQEMIRVPVVGEGPEASHPVPRSTIIEIIHPRVDEIFMHIREKLDKVTAGSLGLQRVILTGGGSQLPGVRELAQTHLGRSVRVGKPQPIPGIMGGDRPEFATVAGLLVYSQGEEFKRMSGFLGSSKTSLSFFRQMASWFKENL